MNEDLYARAKQAFLEARELAESERSDFLRNLGEESEELLLEVRSLLEHADARTATSVPGSQAETVVAPPGDAKKESLENYVLLQRLGAGGMGEVWEAEQVEPVKRRVALKLIQRGMDSREIVARFETERQALALMSHPNIARVFDAGTTSHGRPYFAMELVKGVPIDDYCDRERLSTTERLALFINVCRGVQHAHQKGIIHRDIKPSNVLVSIEDGKPVPKIIDFGVAKATAQRLTERTLFTQLGQWIGTPEYMSPEQAEMTGLDIDTRTDVYSLGVLLYELLVGSLPFRTEDLRSAGFDEMRRKIREDQPTRPSTKITTMGDDSETAARNRRTDPSSLARELEGDLDWITMRCLEKDRTRRYESPSELAADIERFLNNEPVLASPPGTWYLASKFFQRHRLGTIATVLVLAAVALGITGTSIGMVRAQREAEAARLVADEMVNLFGALDPSGFVGPASTREIVERGVERVETRLAGQPLVQARLGAALGNVYANLGDFDKAEAELDKALERFRRHASADDQDYALALFFQGWLDFRKGNYETARTAHEEVLRIRLEALGETNQATITSFIDLGHLEWKVSNFEAAKEYLDRGERLAREVLGEDHWLLGVALHYQGIVRLDTQEYAEARRLIAEALAVAEKTFEPDHGQIAWIVLDMGRAEQLAGDRTAAREHMTVAMAAIEGILGPDHWALGYPLAWLGELESREGNYESATEMFERSLRLRKAALGEDHPDVTWTLRPYGYHLVRLGDFAGAREMFERSIEINRGGLPDDHIQHTYDLSALGWLEYRQGRYAEAETLQQEALDLRIDLMGSESGSLSSAYYNLACLSALQGERDEALDRLRQALDLGFRNPLLFEDTDLDSLRDDSEFQAILGEFRNLPELN